LGKYFLIFYGRVSGESFLFLVEAVTSRIFFAVQRHLFESEPGNDDSFPSGII